MSPSPSSRSLGFPQLRLRSLTLHLHGPIDNAKDRAQKSRQCQQRIVVALPHLLGFKTLPLSLFSSALLFAPSTLGQARPDQMGTGPVQVGSDRAELGRAGAGWTAVGGAPRPPSAVRFLNQNTPASEHSISPREKSKPRSKAVTASAGPDGRLGVQVQV